MAEQRRHTHTHVRWNDFHLNKFYIIFLLHFCYCWSPWNSYQPNPIFQRRYLKKTQNTIRETLIPNEWTKRLNRNKQHHRRHRRHHTRKKYCFGHVYIKMYARQCNTPTNYALFIKCMHALIVTCDIKVKENEFWTLLHFAVRSLDFWWTFSSHIKSNRLYINADAVRCYAMRSVKSWSV